METRTYKTLNGYKLSHSYAIEIQDAPCKDYWGNEGTHKKVTLTSTIHVNKRMECPNSWSDQFSDEEILRDWQLLTFVKGRVGCPFARTEYLPPA